MTNIRPTFYFEKDIMKPIRATGMLLYKYRDSKIEILLNKTENKYYYEDLGGKTDIDDKTYFDTAIREIAEETNLKIIFTMEQICDAKTIYNKKAKYLLFIVEATEEQKILQKNDFDKIETHSNIQREIDWKEVLTFKNIQLHPRFPKKKLKQYFDEIISILEIESKLQTINLDN